MIELYSPHNEIDLVLIRGILDAEGINYFVRNDVFGSMEIGPRIDLFNKKTIMVQEDQYETAKGLLDDHLKNVEEGSNEAPEVKYSFSDKMRMVVEFLLFGWMMPGKRKKGV